MKNYTEMSRLLRRRREARNASVLYGIGAVVSAAVAVAAKIAADRVTTELNALEEPEEPEAENGRPDDIDKKIEALREEERRMQREDELERLAKRIAEMKKGRKVEQPTV